jgi:alpha-galactosidase
MGWNSWNHYHCSINEALIKNTADLLVSTGLAAKGYVYVNLDDCWQVSQFLSQIARNATTNEIIEDRNTFPSGMKALSDYVHSKGLKFGLYSSAGDKTCQGRPGSLNYEK